MPFAIGRAAGAAKVRDLLMRIPKVAEQIYKIGKGGILEGRILSEAIILLIPRGFESYVQEQGVKLYPS